MTWPTGYWKDLALGGLSFDQIRFRFVSSEEYLAKMAEAAQTSTAIVQSMSGAQTAALMARVADSPQNSEALLAEVQRLNALTAAQQVTLNAIAESTGIAGEVLDKAQKGQPLATEAV